MAIIPIDERATSILDAQNSVRDIVPEPQLRARYAGMPERGANVYLRGVLNGHVHPVEYRIGAVREYATLRHLLLGEELTGRRSDVLQHDLPAIDSVMHAPPRYVCVELERVRKLIPPSSRP